MKKKKVMKKILATSWHPGGINAIIPVIKKLRQENRCDVDVFGYEYSEKILEKNNVNYSKIDFYNVNDVSIFSMEKILEIEKPDLVLTGTATQDKNHKYVLEHNITLAAKERSIKSLAVLDLWGNYTERFSDSNTGEIFKFISDKIAILDEICKEKMIEEGFPEKRLAITGNPSFDELIELKNNFSEKDKEKVKQELGLAIDSYLIMYASQPIELHYKEDLGYTEKTVLKNLIESVIDFKDKEKISLLVKLHPRENKEDLGAVIKDYEFSKLQIKLDQEYNTRKAILASDSIFSPFSTVLVESTYLDKPSISIQPGLRDINKDFLVTNSLGITTPIYKKREISSVLFNLLFNTEYLKELSEKRKKLGNDGKATERVCNLVYEMVND